MIGWTHSASGILLSHILTPEDAGGFEKLLNYSLGVIGSLLPDIDTKHSLIHKFFKTGNFHMLFGAHRTFTHTVWAVLLVYVLTGGNKIIVLTYILHLLMDATNYSMIKPFYPLKFKFGVPLCKSGGEVDAMIGMTLWAIVLYLLR